MPWIVYETRHLASGKTYIGVHKQDGDEFDGYLGSGTIIEAAVAKYGRDAFVRRTLFSFETKQEAYAKELELVDGEWVDSTATYNISHGGTGGAGFSQTSEAKDRIRSFRQGRPHSEATREKIRKALTGRKHTEETKAKMRLAHTGRPHTPESKEKLRQARLGYKHSAETIEKIRQASLRRRPKNAP